MEELKPCPFCGGKGKIVFPSPPYMLKRYCGHFVCIGCEDCHICTPIFNMFNCTRSSIMNEANKEKAIKKAMDLWNKRK